MIVKSRTSDDAKMSTRVTKLKICGLTTLADTRCCLAHGIDYVGFNLYPGSKRYIAAAAARGVWMAASAAEPEAPTAAVAVMVDPRPSEVRAALIAFPEIRAVQIHYHSFVPDFLALRLLLAGRALWRAIAVKTAEDIAYADPCGADLLLFDGSPSAPNAQAVGGTGNTFDWSWLDSFSGGVPIGLAGGIGPDLIADAVRKRPMLVDLCSRVEVSAGRKDHTLLAAVVAAFRAAIFHGCP